MAKKQDGPARKPKNEAQAAAPKPTKAAKPSTAKPSAATVLMSAGKKPAKAARSRGLSNEEIGSAAGAVWTALSQGGQTLAGLKKSVSAPDELVLAAVGWLARENKLKFEANGRTLTISLR